MWNSYNPHGCIEKFIMFTSISQTFSKAIMRLDGQRIMHYFYPLTIFMNANMYTMWFCLFWWLGVIIHYMHTMDNISFFNLFITNILYYPTYLRVDIIRYYRFTMKYITSQGEKQIAKSTLNGALPNWRSVPWITIRWDDEQALKQVQRLQAWNIFLLLLGLLEFSFEYKLHDQPNVGNMFLLILFYNGRTYHNYFATTILSMVLVQRLLNMI